MGDGPEPETAQADQSPSPAADLRDYVAGVVGAALDDALLRRALTHRSYAYENGNVPHNERLEFLGDAVLGLVVTDTLFRTHPDLPEGQLAKLRAAVVNSRALADVARTIGLGEYLLLGRGEETTGGRDKPSILADASEALIGCVYVSLGLEAATAFVHHLLDPLMEQSASLGVALDWKTSLQELASSADLGVPEYQVSDEGPDHDKTFTAQVYLPSADRTIGTGIGRSKKEAEQNAASSAWNVLSEEKAAAADSADEDGAEPMLDGANGDTGQADAPRSTT